MKLKGMLLFLLLSALCRCSHAPKTGEPLTAGSLVDPGGRPVPNAPEPEVVQLKKVEMVDREIQVTMSNIAGDYLLVCNPDANREVIQSCLAPRPQQNYLLFRQDTKWQINGAKEPISLHFMQDFSVSYNGKENIGLLPTKPVGNESFRLFWLRSWTATHNPQ